MPMALPGVIIAAAAMAMACFSAMLRNDLASKPGSSLLRSARRVAPPCTLVTSPVSSSISRSRRIVMSLTPSSVESSLARTAPRRRTSATITSWRWRASARTATASTTVLDMCVACPQVLGKSTVSNRKCLPERESRAKAPKNSQTVCE